MNLTSLKLTSAVAPCGLCGDSAVTLHVKVELEILLGAQSSRMILYEINRVMNALNTKGG